MGEERQNPFRGFLDHISETNRMRERWMKHYDPGQEGWERTHATAWVPTADIYAQDGDVVIRCELAGVHQEDIDITLSGGVLTITGERQDRPEDVHYYVHERHYGHFRRTMTMPEGVNEDHISASFEDGMLEVLVRDASLSEPSRIQIGEKPDSSGD